MGKGTFGFNFWSERGLLVLERGLLVLEKGRKGTFGFNEQFWRQIEEAGKCLDKNESPRLYTGFTFSAC